MDYTALLVWAGITIFVFVIGRELICWYLKINERVNLLKRQNELLEAIAKDTGRWARTPVRSTERSQPPD